MESTTGWADVPLIAVSASATFALVRSYGQGS
jgi:hypothetical protein